MVAGGNRLTRSQEREHLRQVLLIIGNRSDIDPHAYNLDHVGNCVSARLDALGLDDLSDYLDLLRRTPAEVDMLVGGITVNASSFFRDSVVFGVVAERVIPRILHRIREGGGRQIRIWSAGCAAGQEAWSLAILVREGLRRSGIALDAHVFGTDISMHSLELARIGRYEASSVSSVPVGIIDRYFRRAGELFEVAGDLREIVHYSLDDVTSMRTRSPSATIYNGFDLVLCRNLLLYLRDATKRRVLEKLSSAVARGGFLVLGSSETLRVSPTNDMEAFDPACRIYRRRSKSR